MTASVRRIIAATLLGALLCGIGYRIYVRTADGGERTSRGARPALVTLAPVDQREITDEIPAIGTALANESVSLVTKVSDTIRAVNFEDGQPVAKGAVIVALTNLEETAQLEEAHASLDDANRQLQRAAELSARGALPVSSRDDALAKQKGALARYNATVARLANHLIRAPFAGVLGLRRVSPGTLVSPNTEITTLDDISVIKLDFAIPERFVGQIAAGMRVIAVSAAWPQRPFVGRVASLDSRVDPATRSITVRAVIPNPNALLRPGMLLSVRLVQASSRALTIPEAGLLQQGERTYVYVAGADRKAYRRDVTVGRRRAGFVEITAGLTPGASVITDGNDRLRPGMPVRLPTAAAEQGSGRRVRGGFAPAGAADTPGARTAGSAP